MRIHRRDAGFGKGLPGLKSETGGTRSEHVLRHTP